MIMRDVHWRQYPKVFQAVTGLQVTEFDPWVEAVLPVYAEAERKRLERPGRQRALGAGHPFALAVRDQLLLAVVWLRLYPTHEVLGYLFGVSDSAVWRVIDRVLPVLAQAGRDTMRMPDPGKKRRRTLEQLLQDTPELAVVIDSFEQRVPRPQERAEADGYSSSKKRQRTLKSQVAVDEHSGRIVADCSQSDVSASVPGPTADITLLKQSGIMARLPAGVGAIGDLAYVGIDKLHPEGLGACPRRKPRGQPRSAEDRAYNTAFSRRRIRVEHTLNRQRRYQSLTQTDRHHRRLHTARVVAVAGLVNRQIDHRLSA
mgnify:FL=1